MRETLGWEGYLIPAQQKLFKSMCEAVLAHPVVKDVVSRCRAAAVKKVVGVDAQYKTLLGVLYQVPHGSSKGASVSSAGTDVRALITVQ